LRCLEFGFRQGIRFQRFDKGFNVVSYDGGIIAQTVTFLSERSRGRQRQNRNQEPFHKGPLSFGA
jgi:hypothetical protein